MLACLLASLFGYLAGSIPFGVIISRLGGAIDPREVGSGNIGATNVLRSGRKHLAAVTLLADVLKGPIAVAIAARYDNGTAPIHFGIAAAAGAFLGHLYPVFLGFRGGKGVATFLGCLIGLAWPAALAFAAAWLATAYLTRYSSASALVASAAMPVVLILFRRPEEAVLFGLLTAVLWWKHSGNIGRLRAGTESKIGQKSGTAA